VNALLRSELLKLRTTRAVVVYPIALAAITALGTAGRVGAASGGERFEESFQPDLVGAAGFAGVLALIVGITAATAEFRHGTITPTFLVCPVRERVLAAKALTATAAGCVLALTAIGVAAAVSVPWLAALDVPLALGDGDVMVRAGRVVLGGCLWGAFGVAVGAVVHSQVGALVGALVWLLLVEPLAGLVLDVLDVAGGGKFLPGQALDAVTAPPGQDLLAFWPGLGVSLAYLAQLGVLGALRTRRRDVTG
jgi:hypothetical protein